MKPKLLYVATTYLTLRGFIRPFAIHFRNMGWHVDGLANGISECDQCKSCFTSVWDVSWSRNPLDLHIFTAIREIKQIIERGDYDIIHVHTPIAAFLTRFAVRNLKPRPKIVYTAHGFHFHKKGNAITNNFFKTIEKIGGRWTDKLIVINREDRYSAVKFNIIKPEDLIYMPGIGIDLGTYNTDSNKNENGIRHELKLKDDLPIFLVIAEFNNNKNHKMILQSFSKLDNINAHLVLAGTGKLERKMFDLANKLKLSGRVHFLGYRTDIPNLILESSAVILTSYREGLPRSLMEALAIGKPVIGTNIRGIRDLIKPDCGIMIEPNDMIGLTKAMKWVIENPEKAKIMGKYGRKYIEEYDLKKILILHSELYLNLLGIKKYEQISDQKAI